MQPPYDVSFSDKAAQDLDDIFDYLTQYSLQHAKQLINMLDRLCHQQLAYFPEMGRERMDLKKNLRSLSVGNYLIFSTFINGVVHIERIVHESQDYSSFDEFS